MRAEKASQGQLWRFQCLTTFLIYVPSLIIITILVNFYQGFNQSPGTIYQNHEFNSKICMSIATGLISLLLAQKPNILDLIGK